MHVLGEASRARARCKLAPEMNKVKISKWNICNRSPFSLSAGLVRLYSHLSQRRRWQLIGLIILMFLGAVAEMATLGAVFPFLALLGINHWLSNIRCFKGIRFIDLGEGRNIIFSAAVLLP